MGEQTVEHEALARAQSRRLSPVPLFDPQVAREFGIVARDRWSVYPLDQHEKMGCVILRRRRRTSATTLRT